MEYSVKHFSLIIFLTSYILFIVVPNRRTLIAILASVLVIVLEFMAGKSSTAVAAWVLFDAINWNVMGIFVGTLFVADIFMESKAPAYFAEKIVNKSGNVAIAILAICALTSIISAFVENVATVLIVAPIALSLSKKLKINPMNIMIAIAICSNLQGTATLIGDPPSMLLGGFAKMTFFDFFIYKGKPSIFFAVELGAIFSFAVLYYIFRKHKEPISVVSEERVSSWFPTILLVLLIVLLALSSFFDTGFSYLAGIICMLFGITSLLWSFVKRTRAAFFAGLKSLDWDTTFFLIAIFVIVENLSENGWIEIISSVMAQFIGDNLFLGFVVIVFASVAISAFVDNVPYLAAMLPVAISLADHLAVSPPLFLFGLLIGASLGGNITPIGASANIVACGLLRKEGINVTFGDFARLGLPFTIAAVLSAALFVWFVWS